MEIEEKKHDYLLNKLLTKLAGCAIMNSRNRGVVFALHLNHDPGAAALIALKFTHIFKLMGRHLKRELDSL